MIVKQVDDMREHYDRITLNSGVKQEDKSSRWLPVRLRTEL